MSCKNNEKNAVMMHIEVMELIFAKFSQGFLVPGKKVYANGQKAWELTGDGVVAGFNERLIAIHIPCSETKHNLNIQRVVAGISAFTNQVSF